MNFGPLEFAAHLRRRENRLTIISGPRSLRRTVREESVGVFEAIVTLYAKGAAVDAITVAEELRRGGALEDVGGAPFMFTLVETGTRVVVNTRESAYVERAKD